MGSSGPHTGREGGAFLLRTAAFMAVSAVALLFLMIAAFAVPAFTAGGGSPFSWRWAPGQGQFGILPMIAGSLVLGCSAVLPGWLLGLGLCGWLLCPARPGNRLSAAARAVVEGLVRMMTAIPTVVYGFAAVFLLVPAVRLGLGGSGFSWLAASVMLSLLILPTVTLVLQAGLKPRLEAVVMAGAALGLSRLETLWFLVLPQARGTLLASAVLGFGRAVGDTMLPLMLAGNAPVSPGSPLSGFRTLTAHMALVTSNEVGGAAYDSLFMAGLILLAVNAAVSLGIRRMGGKP